jgi:signal transduction histidine kinase
MPNRALRFFDVGLAVVAAPALITEGSLRAKGGLSPGAYVLAVAAAAPLAWRTRAPLAAIAGVEVGAVMCAAAFDAGWAATAMVIVELYTVARLGNRHRSLVVGAVTGIGVIVAIVLIEGSLELTAIGLRLLLVFAALAVGDTIRSRQALVAAARERAAREARERDEEDRRRAAEERVRIARELHDTLAHSLVAINVRASVAVDLHDSQDPTEALEDIKQASATALRDLRTTLSLLREQADQAPTAPAVDLRSLPGLVEQARSAGLHADIDVEVDGAAVPSAIAGTAFRIVQEALTNVLRHADASSAYVRVSANGDELDIDVTDNGRADSTAVDVGHGLRGMFERATALGGRLDAGPREEGGWRVHAVLPLSGWNRS